MAQEFIIRKGYIALDDSQITGSLSVTNSVTASFFTGSYRGDGSQLTGIEGFPFTGSAGITGSLTVVGPVNATTFTGDGSQLTGIEGFPFTGSAKITGSLEVTGSVTATSFTGSLQGTATSASYVQLANIDGFTAYSASVNTAIDSVLDATTPLTATVNTTNSPFTITSQSIVIIDSTNGDVTVNLPDLNTINGTPSQKPILLYKNDYSQNVIYVEPSGSQLVNGTTQDIIVSIQIAIAYNPTSAGWVTEGTSYQSLAELELFFVPRTETGSFATTGSNQFSGSQAITGSLTVTGDIIGNITGSAASASYVEYTNVANKPALVSGSSQITYSGLTGIPSSIVSSSAQVSGYGIFATTGSNQFNGNQAITGSLTVTGQVVAQTLNVQQVTSSIVYSSGSNIFGNSISNVQQFTGSLQVSGSSHYLFGNVGVGTNSPGGALQVSNAGYAIFNNSAHTQTPLSTGLSIGYNRSGGNGETSLVWGAPASGFNFEIASVTGGTITPRLTITTTGAATFSSSVTAGASINLPNNFSLTGRNAANTLNLALISRNTSDRVVIDADGYGTNIGGGGTVLINPSGGNVGIGTPSPSGGISGTETALHIYNSNAAVLALQSADPTNGRKYQIYTGNTGALIFRDDTGASTRMVITNGGNILINQTSAILGVTPSVEMSGVGASSPTSQASYNVFAWHGNNPTWRGYLQFTKSRGSSIGSYTVVQNGDDLGTIRWTGADGSGTVIGAEINAYVDGTPGVNDMPTRLAFLTTADGASSPTERMRITSGGNVGVGTPTPGEKLEINGSIRLNDGNADGPQLKLASSGYSDWNLDNFSGAFRAYYGSTEHFRITSGGNVGIFDNAPAYKLSINNGTAALTTAHFWNYVGDQTATTFILKSARPDIMYHMQVFNNNTTECFRIEANGNVKNTNSSYGSLSDIKIKENISDATPKLDDLLKVRIRNYNIIGQDVKQIGVIAQELEEIFPSMVDENEDRDENGNLIGTYTKGVKYSVFVPMLIKAIQEQQSQIESLKAEIQTLKNT